MKVQCIPMALTGDATLIQEWLDANPGATIDHVVANAQDCYIFYH